MFVAVALVGCSKPTPPTDLGTPAHPMGVIEDVRTGMTRDELEKAAPTLTLDHDGNIASLSNDKVGEIYTVFLVDGRVSFFEAEFLHRKPEELWKAWRGHGLDVGHDHFRFVDAKDRLRADVTAMKDGFAVHFSEFVPYATVLAGADANAIDGIEVLGRPLAAVVADFKKAGATIKGNADRPMIALVPNEFSGDLPTLDLVPDAGGMVTSWALIGTVFDPTPEMKKQVIALYAKRWRAPTTEGQRMTFNTEPWIFADESLMVSAYLNGLERMGYKAGSGAGSGSAHAP
jgi:hypothetical protein